MKREFTKLMAALALLVFMMPSMAGWGQTRETKTEGFETASAGTTYNSTQTYTAENSDCGIAWTMYYGTVSTNAKISGTKSAQMRWYSSASSNYPCIYTTTAIDGLSNVNFKAKVGNANVKMDVLYSADGTTWTSVVTGVTMSTTATTYSYTVPSGGKYIKIGVSQSSTAPTSGNYNFVVDDVIFTYSSSGTQLVSTPIFTPDGRPFLDTQEVAISCATDGATIYYTTNGSTPTTSSTVYSAPFTINATTTVKALAVKTGMDNSEVATAEFTKVTPMNVADAIAAITAAGSNIPIENQCVTGIVCTASSNIYSGKLSYYISDDGTTTTRLEAYNGLGLYGDPFTSVDDIQVGDIVVIYGNLTKYNSTYEFAAGNYLLSFERPQVTTHDLAFSASPAAAGTITVNNSTTSPATINEGATVNISATANSGYTFSGWTVSGSGSSVADATSATTTFTMGTADATLTANFQQVETVYVIYYPNGGVGDEIEREYNSGDDVTVASNTFTRQGYVFTNWNTAPNGTGTAYEPNDVIEDIDGDIELYAQWQESSETQDCLDRAFTNVTNTTYTDWTGTGTSGAAYAGNSAGGNTSIQLRSTNNSGIVSTTSGGKVMKVEVVWESHTSDNRVLQVYGSNDAYTAPSNLFSESTQGTLLGTIIYDGNSTSLNITGDYAYVGLRSASGAMYLSSICITWGSASALAAPAIAPATLTFVGSQEITITAAEGASIRYTLDGTEPTATTGTLYEGPFTITNTTTVKAIAYNETTASEVTTATYTRQYNINLVQTTGGVISASAEQAAEGAEVTLTATANVGYSFSAWSVNPNVTVASNQFVMPASDVTVTATFVEATAYTVSFSINNKVEMTATVNDGGAINLSNFQAVPTVEGYSFAGWSATPEGEVLTGSYTPSADATLYAQFGEATASGYSLVTSADELAAGDQIVIAANGTKNWAMSTTQNTNNRGTAILTKNDNGTITIPEEGDINGDFVCQLTLGTTNGHWTLYDATNNGYLHAVAGNNYLRTQSSNDTNGEWTISISNNEATITAQGTNTSDRVLKYNSGNDIFSCYTSGQQTVWLYRKPAAKLVKGNREEIAANATVTDIAANVLVTVKEDGIVYLKGSNNGNEANLVVEDGGQLVTSNNVKGTMLKSIQGYSGERDNYYLISSPMTSTDPVNVGNMLSNDYDLYYFDQDGGNNESELLEWRNYHAHAFNMNVGSGFLYANSDDVDLEFAGQLRKNEDETYEKAITYVEGFRFSGWNLVGNPFPSNASVDLPFYKMNSNSDGINGTAMSANSVIGPMEGVFVIASNATTKVNFTATTDAVSIGAKKSVNIDVKRDNELMDRAIVDFNNGIALRKLNLSENATKVYFQQGQEEFAIVAAENEGELPVNFKASRNGRYTMSFDVENLDMTYLHLIDNKTGNDVDLLATPSYTFQANSSDYESRFRLVFDANTVNENASANETFAYFNGTEWVINTTGNATLQVIDMMGRVLSSQTLNGNANVNINQPAGIYMLRLVNGENVKVQKVVVR